MSARAGVVVTGTEVLTGRVRDRNGPWLSDRLRDVGVDLAHITICGDRQEDMEAQLRFMAEQGVDVVFTSGGLGPTADDLTLEIVARFTGRELSLDEALSERIADIVRPLMKRWPNVDEAAILAANRKQALVPAGATVIEPAGTAPGMIVPAGDGLPAIVVLPGPPRELHAMWPAVLQSEAFQEVLARATDYEQTMLRLFGIPESEIAETLRVAEQRIERFDALEITTCLRRGEVEVVTRYEPAAAGAWDALAALIAERHADTLFSTDGSTVDEQVDSLLGERRLAVAESCTGGLMAARLTERPGSSGHFLGGVVVVRERGEGRAARRRPGADRAPWRGLRRGRRGDGGRRTGAVRRRGRDRDHRDRGTGRRQRGEAGRHRLLVRQGGRRGVDRARNPPSRRPLRHPRSLDDGRSAPAAAPAAGPIAAVP